MKHTNGAAEHGVGGRLGKLLAYHEERAAAIRLVLGELNGTAMAAKRNGHGGVLRAALALEGARRQTKTKKTNIRAQRQASADLLAQFDPKTPRHIEGVRSLGSLVRRGYLRPKGDGYIRTAKEYSVAVVKRNSSSSAAATAGLITSPAWAPRRES